MAITYHIQFSQNADYSAPDIDVSGLTVKTYTPASPLADAYYYIRVREENDGGSVGPWEETTLNLLQLPATPVLSSPANDAWLPASAFVMADATEGLGGSASASSTFSGTYAPSEAVDNTLDSNVESWAAASTGNGEWWQIDLGAAMRILRIRMMFRAVGVADIRVQNDDNSGMTTPTDVLDLEDQVSAVWVEHDIDGTSRDRYWRVLFDTVTSRAGLTEIEILHADGALIWGAAARATSYVVEIALASDPTFSSPVETDEVTTTWYLPTTLSSVNDYIWRITAKNGSGLGTPTTARNLHVQNLPSTITLLTPTHNRWIEDVRLGVGSTNKGSFTWTPDALADTYDFQYSVNSDMSAPTINVTGVATPNYAPVWGGTPSQGVRYWRVRGVNETGNGPWSTIFTINVGENFRTYAEGLSKYKYGYRLNENNSPYLPAKHGAFLRGKDLCRNGDMSSSTGWTITAGWTISGGLLTHSSGGGTTNVQQSNIFTVGRWYEITYTVSGRTTGSVRSGNSAGAVNSSNGTLTEIIQTLNASILFVPTNDFDGSIDNVSVKEVNFRASSEYPLSTGRLNLVTNWQVDLSYGFAFSGVGGGSIAYGSNLLQYTSIPQNGQASQATSMIVGRDYVVSFDVTGYSGSGEIAIGAGSTFGTSRTANGSYSQTLTCSVDSNLRIRSMHATNAFTGQISNIKIEPADNLTAWDGAFETWSSATNLTNWAETIAGTSTVNREATTIHGGTYAVRFDVDGSNSLAQISQVCLTNGRRYYAGVWAKASVAGATFQFGGTIFTLTTSYALYEAVFFTTSTTFAIARTSAAGASIYLDDLTIKEIDPLDVAIVGASPYQSLPAPYDRGVHFDGSGDVLFVDGTPIRSMHQLEKGSQYVFAQFDTGALTDGASHFLARVSTGDEVSIIKSTSNNTIQNRTIFQSTTKNNVHTISTVNVMLGLGNDWDVAGDAKKGYVNGSQDGSTLTGLVASNDPRTNPLTLGASSTVGANSHLGYIVYYAWFDDVLTTAEHLKLNQLAEVA